MNSLSISMKQCNHCDKSFPATTDFFYRQGAGLRPECKTCSNALKHDAYARKHPKKDPILEGYKRCTKCKQIKPATHNFFHKRSIKTEKLLPQCRECRSKPYIKPSVRVCNECKQEKANTTENFYRHRGQCKTCLARIGKTYVEQHREQHRAWIHNYNARKRQASGIHTAQDIKQQLKRQKHKCYYCNKKLEKDYHVDHVIPLVRGGSNAPDNLVIACPHCNTSKNDKFPWEWPEGGRLL